MHKLLQRQLKKALRHSDTETPDLEYLLELVSNSYEEADKERRLTVQAANLMENELKSLHQKNIEQARLYFESVLNQVGDGVLFLDQDNRIQGANEIACQLLNSQTESLKGKVLEQFFETLPDWSSEQNPAIESQTLHDHIPVELIKGNIRNAARQEKLLIFRDISERIQAREKLRASERKFRDYAESSSDWFWETDAQHRIIGLTGYSAVMNTEQRNQLIGKSRMELMKHVPQDLFDQHIQDLNAHRPFRDLEYELELLNGKSLVSINGKPLFSPQGDFIGYRGSARDITEQRQTRDSLTRLENQLRTAISSMNEGIALFDNKDKLVLFNDRAREIYSAISDVIQTGQDYKVIARALIERGAFKLDIPAERWLSYQISKTTRFTPRNNIVRTCNDAYIRAIEYPTPDGGTVGIYSDVTEMVILQNKLRSEKDKAEKANKTKSEFLANMSHEIRTPMNAVIGLSFLALQDEALNEEQKEYLSQIHDSSNHLLGILNDILDYSKIEAGKLSINRHEFEFQQLVRQTSTFIQPLIKKKSLDFYWDIAPDIPRLIDSDLLRLNQILINLAGNAVKFTEQGSVYVAIRFRHTGQNKRYLLEISVKDTGPGISVEQQKRLFAPFTQGDSSITRNYGGTGLGLAICRQLIELMGGQLSLDSAPGKGSCFSFSLIVTAHNKDSFCDKPDMPDMNIAFIDGQSLSARAYSQYIRYNQGHVACFRKLSDMPPASEQQGLDLIIADWEHLSEDERSQIPYLFHQTQTPVLIFTHQDKQSLRSLFTSQDSVTIIEKPITPLFLLDEISSILQTPASDIQPSSSYSHTQSTQHLILLVEDNPLNQMVAGRFLKKVGIDYDVAENGLKALAQLELNQYDLILMDLQMPEMDGITATRMIRKHDQFSELPIIAMTANAMKGDKDRCLEAGMNDYIPKPIDMGLLKEKLSIWLTSDSSERHEARNEKPTDRFPIFNKDKVMERLEHSEELLELLISEFLREYADKNNQQLYLELTQDTDRVLQEKLHSLKGSSSTIGADRLTWLIVQAEQKLAAGKQNTTIRQQHLADIQHALDEILLHLNTLHHQETATQQQVDK